MHAKRNRAPWHKYREAKRRGEGKAEIQASTELLCFLAASRGNAHIEMRDKVAVRLQALQWGPVMLISMLNALPHYILHCNTLC